MFILSEKVSALDFAAPSLDYDGLEDAIFFSNQ